MTATVAEIKGNGETLIDIKQLFQAIDYLSNNFDKRKISTLNKRIPLEALMKNILSLSHNILSVSPLSLSYYGLNPLLILDPLSNKLISINHKPMFNSKKILLNPIPWLRQFNRSSTVIPLLSPKHQFEGKRSNDEDTGKCTKNRAINTAKSPIPNTEKSKPKEKKSKEQMEKEKEKETSLDDKKENLEKLKKLLLQMKGSKENYEYNN